MTSDTKTGLGRLAQIQGAVEVRGWRQQYRQAHDHWRNGDRDAIFPHGTYAMRRDHGAQVAEPTGDAWISAPGPTMDDVKALLDEGRAQRDEHLVDRVHDVVLDAARLATLDHDDSELEPSSELHRFAKRRPAAPDDQPRRLIILRDKRHGRNTGDPPDL